MKVFECKMCGAALHAEPGQPVCRCEYCGSTNTLPQVNEERIVNLFNKANSYRLKSEFDRASNTYEIILDEDFSNAEAHWGIVLCNYGVEYVKDSDGHMIPTCHRARHESILSDPDYLEAVANSDIVSKMVYEGEAKNIALIQKHILEVSAQEDPYDVFICFKNTDEFGNETEDTDIARTIYLYLKDKNYRVFFSPVSLLEYAGEDYEPHIFAALDSAKLMLVVGTNVEYIHAPWVRNEWGRFLSMAKKKGSNKVLIPCIKDLSPYDLPGDFSNCEVLNTASPSFWDSLQKNASKIIVKEKKVEEPKIIAGGYDMNSDAAATCKRGFISLESGEFSEAIECFNKSLDKNPENSKTYWGLLLAHASCRNNDELANRGTPFTDDKEYQKAARFADEKTKAEYDGVIQRVTQKIQSTIKQLEQAENAEVQATGAADVIKSCKAKETEVEQKNKQLLEQLLSTEYDLQNSKDACSKELDAILKELDSSTADLPDLDLSGRQSEYISASENKTMSNRLTEIQSTTIRLKSKLTDTVDNSDCFKKLRSDQKRQSDIQIQLKNQRTELKNVIYTMERLKEQVSAIHRKYDVAYSEVQRGVYSSANRLLSSPAAAKAVSLEQVSLENAQKEQKEAAAAAAKEAAEPILLSDDRLECPRCHTVQRSNRRSCFKCNLEFSV